MRAQEMLAESGVEAFRYLRQWNAAGVGGEDRLRLPQRRDAPPQCAFDVQVLRHRFDDPLAIRNTPEIVFEIAWSDQRLGRFRHERHGPLLRGTLNAEQCGLIAFRLIWHDDIEQVHRKSGVCKMGGNS